MPVDFAPGATGTDEVLFARQGPLARIRLHRPRAINALTHGMVLAMHLQLEAWAGDDSVTGVVLDGAGERGLCAGGDIRSLRAQIAAGNDEAAVTFWSDEYQLNALIHHYPKPYVALMTGVVMGGGVGISAYGSLRLVTPDARVAMPETGIGFFPDVGSLYLLSRAPGELGAHLALTGPTVGGADAVACGLADAVVEQDELATVVERLADGEPMGAATVGVVAPDSPLASQRSWIDACYAGDDPAAMLEALRTRPEPAAQEAAALLGTRSPWSVAVTLEALRRAARMSTLEEVLEQDRALGVAFLERSDFLEGVRALLVDKDHDPQWRAARLEDVPRDEVLALFEPGQRRPRPAENAAAPPDPDDVL